MATSGSVTAARTPANQQTAARALGITARRFRQLEEECVLPIAGDDGKYDLDACHRRYSLFRSEDGLRWHEFDRDLERGADEVDRLLQLATVGEPNKEAVGAAIRALFDQFDKMRFRAACQERHPAAREFVINALWLHERELFGPLWDRAKTLVIAEREAAQSRENHEHKQS